MVNTPSLLCAEYKRAYYFDHDMDNTLYMEQVGDGEERHKDKSGGLLSVLRRGHH